MRCSRNPACVSVDGHADLCVRLDGAVILARRTPEATAQIAAARTPPDAIPDASVTDAQVARAVSLGASSQAARDAQIGLDWAARQRATPPPDPTEEAARRVHAATPEPGPVFRVDETRPADRTYDLLPPSEAGGPECNHTRWMAGCRPCADWAVSNGVAFARHMSARPVPPPPAPSIVLTGEAMEAFDRFALAAAALEQHAEQGQALQVAYRNALPAVSAMAARRHKERE